MKSVNKLLALGALLLPASAFALDIGNIDVHSEMYQPLRAELQLTNTLGVSVKELQVGLAPANAYYLRGISMDPVVSQINFGIKHVDGNEIIVLSTPTPITEPIVNFLVEFQWPQGEAVKEVTLLPHIPGQGDDDAGAMIVKGPDPLKQLNKEASQEIAVIKTDTEKFWYQTINKFTQLTNQYKHSL
jgi:pilus assembly protein FimV